MSTLARLQPNMRVLFEGRPHVVRLVNECRARIEPEQRVVKQYVPQSGRDAGKVVQFAAREHGHNISPESELPIL